jgi:alpha-amylase
MHGTIPTRATAALVLAIAVTAGCDVPEALDRPDAAATHDAAIQPPSGPRTAFVHLFEWRWDDIALECEQILGPAGFAAVQVSPPQEHAVFSTGTWWQRYQPVSYRLVSRSGDRAAFADMVSRCNQAGVAIYVDAILNHMSFVASGTGSGGSAFTKYRYPGIYDEHHFHACRRPIHDWGSRDEIQRCELATCADLDTSDHHVRATLAAYLQDLVDLGVAGIRVDAAKHIPATDLAAIFDLVNGELFAFHEVIDHDGGGAVTAAEYTALGHVTEFRYGADLSRVIREGKLAWLATFGESWAYLPSRSAIAFVDNHDNQRGHGSGNPLTHREPELYRLANVLMLAFPYGYPQLMSSYVFAGPDDGPPSDAQHRTTRAIDPVTGACNPGWVCEHRWPAIAGMVGFRTATAEAPTVTDWWDDGDNAIAFGRGALGFVAVNRTAQTLVRVLATSLPPGRYCDVVNGGLAGDACTGETLVVAPDGTIAIALAPRSALAIHHQARAH